MGFVHRFLVSSALRLVRPATVLTEAQRALGLAEFSSLGSSVSIVICSGQGVGEGDLARAVRELVWVLFSSVPRLERPAILVS